MDAEYFRTLYDYMCWARDKVLGAAEGMTEEEYAKPNGFTYGSVRGILTHTLAGEVVWLSRCRGEAMTMPTEEDVPTQEDLPTLESLKARWQEEESKQRAYLSGLSDADIKGEVVFARRDGSEMRRPLWEILTLVFHHTVQHRSEAAEALTMAGRSPGPVDFLMYAWR